MNNNYHSTNNSSKIPLAFNMDSSRNHSYVDNYNRGASIKKGNKSDIVSILTWLSIFIILLIPLINLIALIIMSLININQNIKNFSRAGLIIYFTCFILLLLK